MNEIKSQAHFRAQVIILKKALRDQQSLSENQKAEIELLNQKLQHQIQNSSLINIDLVNSLMNKYFSTQNEITLECGLLFLQNLTFHVDLCFMQYDVYQSDYINNDIPTLKIKLRTQAFNLPSMVNEQFKKEIYTITEIMRNISSVLSILFELLVISPDKSEKGFCSNYEQIKICRTDFQRKRLIILLLNLQISWEILLNVLNLTSDSISQFVSFLRSSLFYNESQTVLNSNTSIEKTFLFIKSLAYNLYRTEIQAFRVKVESQEFPQNNVETQTDKCEPTDIYEEGEEDLLRQRTLADIRIHQFSETIQVLNAKLTSIKKNEL